MQKEDDIIKSVQALDDVLRENLGNIHCLLSLNRTLQSEVEATDKRLGELKVTSAVESIKKCIKLGIDAKSIFENIANLLKHQTEWQDVDELQSRLPELVPKFRSANDYSKNHFEVPNVNGVTNCSVENNDDSNVVKYIDVKRVDFSAGGGNSRKSNVSVTGAGDSNTDLEKVYLEQPSKVRIYFWGQNYHGRGSLLRFLSDLSEQFKHICWTIFLSKIT